MLLTILSILGLIVLLALLVSAYSWWLNQGPFGWFMAISLTDDIGHVFCLICSQIISLFKQD